MSAPRVLFVLPARGASGGANSVVQECIGLSRIGCTIGLAVSARHSYEFGVNYPELKDSDVQVEFYATPKELGQHLRPYQIAVGTVNDSVFEIGDAIEHARARIKTAYYVQDYEPLFYPVDTADWRRAYASYTKLPGCALFAKTEWLRRVVYENHGVAVSKVSPSLDHEEFYPDLERTREGLTVVAMLRPRTPRRAPHRTLRVISRLAEELKGEATFKVFGCSEEDLQKDNIELPEGVVNLGRLKRTEVPDLMRAADMFLDVSDYQAFGRTGLEAMACGCVPVVPVLGGTAEFAMHGQNAFVVDTRADDEICDAVHQYVEMSPRYREDLRMNGLQTAAEFSIGRAALSEYRFFSDLLAA